MFHMYLYRSSSTHNTSPVRSGSSVACQTPEIRKAVVVALRWMTCARCRQERGERGGGRGVWRRAAVLPGASAARPRAAAALRRAGAGAAARPPPPAARPRHPPALGATPAARSTPGHPIRVTTPLIPVQENPILTRPGQ